MLLQCEACPYGDADFAMAVRASGHKALLQPLAVVYYQGDPSDLADLSGEVVAESRDRFIRKWGSSLVRGGCWWQTQWKCWGQQL